MFPEATIYPFFSYFGKGREEGGSE